MSDNDILDTPVLLEVAPKILQLTLNPKQVFAVWRACECYTDLAAGLDSIGKTGSTSVARSAGEVQEVLAEYMRKVLGLIEGEDAESSEKET